jgi:hypothetical protein
VEQVLELEYHFPRHSHFLACDETFSKLIQVARTIVEWDTRITCSGSTIADQKKDLIRVNLNYINTIIPKRKLQPISLSPALLPLTLYAHHSTKEQSEKFVANVLKLSTLAGQLKPSPCQEYVLVLNKLVRVRCRWGDPSDPESVLTEILDNIRENALSLPNQAVLAIEKLREVLAAYSQAGKQLMVQDPIFKL